MAASERVAALGQASAGAPGGWLGQASARWTVDAHKVCARALEGGTAERIHALSPHPVQTCPLHMR
eukprot:13807202-Alexandrium_andersonii.AAC.1